MKFFRNKASLIIKLSLVLTLLGIFGKKNKTEKTNEEKEAQKLEIVKNLV